MALYLEEINELGQSNNYQRIKHIEYDFDREQVSIILEKYVSEEFRNKEKKAHDDIKLEIQKFKREKILDEGEKLAKMQELESKEVKPYSVGYEKFTFPIPADMDIREIAYNLLTKNVDKMKGGKKV